ncbi:MULTISPECIES: autotransporter assembly complex protein TamA [Actibacterium]|uniref:Translocation and assembly module TamA n=1 Tax=Actibacterium naphthalenivorans TaxID=1614693 RepID=A0A840CEQ7_9RHOB|nr:MULTISPECIES: autotransporter assembly complex family protein [Actibacterium]ALG92069.1 membrane protein [Actibacterium sp. EMB200-NS6]MBB4021769.1 translocation and assembly module TamA [Actibacterium naphthalenivorans]
MGRGFGRCAVAIVIAGWAGMASGTEVRLTVSGAGQGLEGDLRAASLVVSTAEDEKANPQDLLSAARADYARLVGVLYGAGYYSPVVHIIVDGAEAAVIPPYGAPARIDTIALSVTTGPRFAFSRARLAPLAPGTELPEAFAAGKTAESGVIVDAVTAGIDGWRAQGHAKAAPAGQSLVADHATNTLDADIRLAPGPRLTFGRLTLSGTTRMREERVRAIAGLPSGETFSPDALERSATRLRRSGVFRSVTLNEAATPGPDGTLDIEAALVDDKKRRLGVGAELSSLEGLRLSTFWLHRNLMRGGERLRIDAEAGGIGGESGGTDYRLGANITRPATFGPDTSLSVFGNLEELDEPEYFEHKFEFGFGLSRQISDDLTVGAGVTYRYSEVEDALGDRSFNHITFPLFATRDKRDDRLNASNGTYVHLAATPFVGIDNSTSGAQIVADTRVYRGFGADDRTVLAARVQLGSVVGASTGEVPPDILFFSGGGGTVRGQPYQSLGVDLPSGDTIGGRGFLGLSTELRVGVTESIGVVGFADAGYVGPDSWPGGSGDWHTGAGLGLRYDTGIGPIRFDIAAPVSGSTGDGVQFYIGIGQAF